MRNNHPILKDHVKVGVGVIIYRDHKILLGKRINSHGHNTWSPTGGNLELYESPLSCAKREVMEETSLTLTQIKNGPWTNDVFVDENKHYITLFMFAQSEGDPIVNEPDKCLTWQWFDINSLPSPLFLPFNNLISTYPDIISSMLHEL